MDFYFYAEDLPTAPGSSVDYIFTVKNFDGTKRCEVALDYGIEIVTHNNLPLTFELSSVPPSSLNHALTPVTPVPGAVAGSPTVKNRYSGGHLGVDSNYGGKSLHEQSSVGPILINPLIYAEIAPAFASQTDLDQWLDPTLAVFLLGLRLFSGGH